MKRETRNQEIIHGNYLNFRENPKGWAIVIIPSHVRIDNFHGYTHIHFSSKGEKHNLNKDNFNEIYTIIRNHLKKNKKRIIRGIIMIEIKLTKTITGKELNDKFEKKYGSIQKLEKMLEKDPENMLLFSDLEDWKFFGKYPDETINEGRTILTDTLTLTNLEIELLNFIKNENPKSIRELARMIHEDVSNTQRRISRLEKEGLLELKQGSKNSKIPTLNYDKIEIAI